MSLTKQQIDEKMARGKELALKIQKTEKNIHGTFVSMFIFLILGIFFFPCLVIALICFLLCKYAKGQVAEMQAEMESIENIPEVRERLDQHFDGK